MTRLIALFAALTLTALTVTSARAAGVGDPLRFNISPSRQAGYLQVGFTREDRGGGSNWNTDFPASSLVGLDLAALRGAAPSALRFAVVREAGRLDCAGTGANAIASGQCAVTPDPAFGRLLKAKGIAAPTSSEQLGLIALDVRHELIEALSAARFPTPTVSHLVELTAVGASPTYIRGLAAAGYRPDTLGDLVQFAALGVTPAYIGDLARAGYSGLSAGDVVQFRALGIDGAYVAGFDRLGYGRLPASKLVQMKALGVTPDFVRAMAAGGALPSPERAIQVRAVTSGIDRK